MKSGLLMSSEISTPVVLNAQSCVVAAVSPTWAISTSTAYQILSFMIYGMGLWEWDLWDGWDLWDRWNLWDPLFPCRSPFLDSQVIQRAWIVAPMLLHANE